MQPDANIIDQLVERIVEVVNPLKIILFGSAARGEMGPDSDVDVLVSCPMVFTDEEQRSIFIEKFGVWRSF